MKYDFVFDSGKKIWGRDYEEVAINRETNPQVSVAFEKEGVILYASCDGDASFCDLEGNVLHKEKAELDRCFSSVRVRVHEGCAVAEFPITEWIDHYPHCDGEYDRWTERVLGTVTIRCPRQ